MVDVLHLAYGGIGGHRAVVEGLATHHQARGVRSGVVLIAPTASIEQTPKWRGVTTEVRIGIRRRGDIRSMAAVTGSVRKCRPRVVIAHSHRHLPAAWLGMLLAGRRPKAILVEHQSLGLRRMSDEIWSAVGTILTRATVVLSESYRAKYRWTGLSRVLRRRIEVIPNGVAIPAGEPAPARRSGGETFRIGMASRLIPSKDFKSLISALTELDGDTRSYHLTIAGDGSERSALEQFTQATGNADRISFEGALSPEEMDTWYESLSCYVQSTLGETMSMSLLEAAAHGLPIITSEVDGVKEVFTPDESAIVLETTTPSSIADAIRRLEDEHFAHQLATAAHKTVVERHSAESMANRYWELLAAMGTFR